METSNPQVMMNGINSINDIRVLKSSPSKLDDNVDILHQAQLNKQRLPSALVQQQHRPQHHVAILLPITSPCMEALRNISELVDSFANSTETKQQVVKSRPSDYNKLWKFSFFLGIDTADQDLADRTEQLSDMFHTRTRRDVNVKLRLYHYPDGNTCWAWRDLANCARQYQDEDVPCDLFILAHDKVKFQSAGNWWDEVERGFSDMSRESGHPWGFGALGFVDETVPGFPSCPILHRTHLDIFHGDMIPSTWVGSDDDNDLKMFLFEIYFRFNCAKLLPSVHIGRVGNVSSSSSSSALMMPPSSAINLWSGEPLTRALEACTGWLKEHCGKGEEAKPLRGIDVVVPSFRAPRAMLERILSLPVPNGCACRYVLICDNPDSAEAMGVFREMEQANASNVHVRLRANDRNMGPGETRNHGLRECSGEYVVFLDDDVVPEQDILERYHEQICRYPTAAGFVGRTVLPPAVTPRQFGIKFAGIAYFWDIAIRTSEDLPWGITANLCVKRWPEMRFHTDLFSNYGGEDVDICLRLDELNRKHHQNQNQVARSFIPTPNCVVHHPWWNNGDCQLRHFFAWAKGDSALIEVHPRLAFRSFPDCIESFTLLAVVQLGMILAGGGSGRMMMSVSTAAMNLLSFSLAEVLYETLAHRDLAGQKGPWFTLKVGFMTCLVRTWSEIGRVTGQLERGTLLRCLFTRFNWFDYNLPEWPQIERTKALKRGLFRIAFMLTVWWWWLR